MRIIKIKNWIISHRTRIRQDNPWNNLQPQYSSILLSPFPSANHFVNHFLISPILSTSNTSLYLTNQHPSFPPVIRLFKPSCQQFSHSPLDPLTPFFPTYRWSRIRSFDSCSGSRSRGHRWWQRQCSSSGWEPRGRSIEVRKPWRCLSARWLVWCSCRRAAAATPPPRPSRWSRSSAVGPKEISFIVMKVTSLISLFSVLQPSFSLIFWNCDWCSAINVILLL